MARSYHHWLNSRYNTVSDYRSILYFVEIEVEIETMEMRLRRHAKGDGPWEEEHFVMPEASGGTIRREVCQKGATQVMLQHILNGSLS